MGLMDRFIFKGQSSNVKSVRDSKPPVTGQETQSKARLLEEAEILSKTGRLPEAEAKYLESISEEDKEGPKALWRKFGPASARYEALAKLYYHTNRDSLALQVMDQYLTRCEQSGKDDIRMKRLREGMATGGFKRIEIKGWDYPRPDTAAGETRQVKGPEGIGAEAGEEPGVDGL